MRASRFRPSQDEVRTQFAEAVSGNFIDGSLLRPNVVHAKVGEWTVCQRRWKNPHFAGLDFPSFVWLC